MNRKLIIGGIGVLIALFVFGCGQVKIKVINLTENKIFKEIKIGKVTIEAELDPGESSSEYEIKPGIYIPTYQATYQTPELWFPMTGKPVEVMPKLFQESVTEIELNPELTI